MRCGDKVVEEFAGDGCADGEYEGAEVAEGVVEEYALPDALEDVVGGGRGVVGGEEGDEDAYAEGEEERRGEGELQHETWAVSYVRSGFAGSLTDNGM